MIAQKNRNNCSSVNSNYNLLFISQSVHVSVCVSTSVSAGIRSDEFKVTTVNCIQFSTIQNFGPETSSLDFEPSWQLRTQVKILVFANPL